MINMKIAIIVNCLKMGGMERVAVNLADAFHDAGHTTDLIYLKNRKKEIHKHYFDNSSTCVYFLAPLPCLPFPSISSGLEVKPSTTMCSYIQHCLKSQQQSQNKQTVNQAWQCSIRLNPSSTASHEFKTPPSLAAMSGCCTVE